MKLFYIILFYLSLLIYTTSEYINQLKSILIKNNIKTSEFYDISYFVYTICTDKLKIEEIILYTINSLKKIDTLITRRIYHGFEDFNINNNKINQIINSIENYIIKYGIKSDEKDKFKKNIDIIKLQIIKYIVEIQNRLFTNDEQTNIKYLYNKNEYETISSQLINKLEINDNNHFYYNIYFLIKNELYKKDNKTRKLHIGLILDGNRRFAKKNNFKNGHLFGSFNAIRIINYLYYSNIKECTLYVLSYDNLIKRSNEEKNIIYGIIYSYLLELINYIVTHGNIYVQFIGEINLLPKNIQERINNINNICSNKNIDECYVINYAIAYDGRREIYHCMKKYFLENSDNIKTDSNMMSLKRDIDIVIRSGGTQRMSSFFPWQTTYAEWYFMDKYWPEVTEEDINNIINDYNKKIMNYGA